MKLGFDSEEIFEYVDDDHDNNRHRSMAMLKANLVSLMAQGRMHIFLLGVDIIKTFTA